MKTGQLNYEYYMAHLAFLLLIGRNGFGLSGCRPALLTVGRRSSTPALSFDSLGTDQKVAVTRIAQQLGAGEGPLGKPIFKPNWVTTTNETLAEVRVEYPVLESVTDEMLAESIAQCKGGNVARSDAISKSTAMAAEGAVPIAALVLALVVGFALNAGVIDQCDANSASRACVEKAARSLP